MCMCGVEGGGGVMSDGGRGWVVCVCLYYACIFLVCLGGGGVACACMLVHLHTCACASMFVRLSVLPLPA